MVVNFITEGGMSFPCTCNLKPPTLFLFRLIEGLGAKRFNIT